MADGFGPAVAQAPKDPGAFGTTGEGWFYMPPGPNTGIASVSSGSWAAKDPVPTSPNFAKRSYRWEADPCGASPNSYGSGLAFYRRAGFYVATRWQRGAVTAGSARGFCGFAKTATFTGPGAWDPVTDTTKERFGLSSNSPTGNYWITACDGATLYALDLGAANFASNQNNLVELVLWARASAPSVMYWSVKNVQTGFTRAGTVLASLLGLDTTHTIGCCATGTATAGDTALFQYMRGYFVYA